MGVYIKFQGCLPVFGGCFKEVSRVFQGSFWERSRVFQLRLNDVSSSFKGVSSLKGIPGKFQWC